MLAGSWLGVTTKIFLSNLYIRRIENVSGKRLWAPGHLDDRGKIVYRNCQPRSISFFTTMPRYLNSYVFYCQFFLKYMPFILHRLASNCSPFVYELQ